MPRKKKNKESLPVTEEIIDGVEITEEVEQVKTEEVTEATEEVTPEEAEVVAPVEVIKLEIVAEKSEPEVEEPNEVEALCARVTEILKNNIPRTYIPQKYLPSYAKLLLKNGTVAVLKNAKVVYTPIPLSLGGRKELMRKHAVKYILNDLL
jgi:hypothetical protein